MCGQSTGAHSAVVDLTWDPIAEVQKSAEYSDLPWVQLDITNRPFIQAADDYLKYANATDAALIFQDQKGEHSIVLQRNDRVLATGWSVSVNTSP